LEKEGRDRIALLLDYYFIIIMYYMRELAPSWIACGKVKVLKKVKNSKIMRKEERSLVRRHELGKLSSPPLEKEDKGML